jgi:hypothetical protein
MEKNLDQFHSPYETRSLLFNAAWVQVIAMIFASFTRR